MAIASKGRGKSGGARSSPIPSSPLRMEGKVYLMSVYDKADFSTVDLSVLKEIVKKISGEGLLRHTALSFKHKITTKAPFPIQYESGKFNDNCISGIYLFMKIIFFSFLTKETASIG